MTGESSEATWQRVTRLFYTREGKGEAVVELTFTAGLIPARPTEKPLATDELPSWNEDELTRKGALRWPVEPLPAISR